MVPPPFDWALLLVRFGLLAADSSPSADAALASLAYLTAHPGTALERPTAGQELCIAPPPENDPYWNDVLERYLHHFPLLPRVLTRTKLGGNIPLHRCSLYLLFEPASHARQVFLRIQFLSTNGNWNPSARFAVLINARSHTREIFNQFENFDLMGVRNGVVLMSVPEHNRTFTMLANCRQRTLDYVMDVSDVRELLANHSSLGLQQSEPIVVARRAEFPFFIHDRSRIEGVYYKFFTAFARQYKARVVFGDRNVQIVMTIHNRETLTQPYAIGSFTGNCVIVPERPKAGLVHFLLSPFSSPVWYLCCCFLAAIFLLNWRWPHRFQHNILLTVLFGDQAADERYSLPERRLIFLAICGNAEYMLHKEMRDTRVFRVPYYILGEMVGWRMNGFSVSKFSSIAGELVEFIGRIGQAGLWEYWREQYVQKLRNVARKELSQRETLLMGDLISLQYVLTVGYASAAIVFGVEMMMGCAQSDDTLSQSVLITLRHVTTRAESLERPSAGQELCISTSATHPHWNDVLQAYLHEFPLYPKVLTPIEMSDVKLPKCSLYLLFEPNASARQLFLLLKAISSNSNWNTPARVILLTGWIERPDQFKTLFKVFYTMGMHNVIHLVANREANDSAIVGSIERGFIQSFRPGSPHYRQLLADRTSNLHQLPLVIEKKVVFPYLMYTRDTVSDVYRQFFDAFAAHINMRVTFDTTNNQILLGIKAPNALSVPIAADGALTGNCLVVPEKPKAGLIHYLLFPFTAPLWHLCCCLAGATIVLNCQCPARFGHSILLTILFGDQDTRTNYGRTERRLIFFAVLVMFFLSESYTARLLSEFIRSLNEPRLTTIRQFAASGIALELPSVQRDRATLLTEELRHNLLVSDKYTYLANVRRGQHALLLDCGNAQHLVHEILNESEDEFPVRYYILQEFVGWRINGWSLTQFAGRIAQAGLWDCWHGLYVKRIHSLRSRSTRYRKTLTMRDLISLHYLLLAGHGVSAGVFVMEIATHFALIACGRYELCLVTHATDPYWSSVVEGYLSHFSSYPRGFLNAVQRNAVQLHRCSVYLIVAPLIEGIQLYGLLQNVSAGRNWNPAAHCIVAINDRPTLASLVNVFRAFPPLGIRNGAVVRYRRGIIDTLVCEYNTSRVYVVTGTGIAGVYRWFFVAFAKHINALALFDRQPNTTRYEIALKIHDTYLDTLKPVAFGSFSGDCVVLPEVSKRGLLYFLLLPFTRPVWLMCGLLAAGSFLLNWLQAQRFPNALLLTLLFGDQAQRYTLTERRLLTVGSVLLFTLTEAYWGKLHALFMVSLNEPHLRTVEQFLRTSVPLEMIHRDAASYYHELHRHRQLIVPETDAQHMDNVQNGRCALLMPCSNARLLLHLLLNVNPDHLDGLSVFRYSPIADQLVQFVGTAQQAGLAHYWRTIYVRQLEGIAKRGIIALETLDWDELASFQYLLFAGYATALVAFPLELLSDRFRRVAPNA
uniref:Ionotropic glutamate receptor L-glutamate and glycine-binding domain-containing protein n=1 Tax=Anopheles melas TaxID=34690 RepID=A0A182TPN9_9DIPT